MLTEANPTHETHEVFNVPPFLQDYNPYLQDSVVRDGVDRERAAWAQPALEALGEKTGRAEFIALGFQANENPPELKCFDRFGRRIDEVEYHPAYHQLMAAGVEAQVHAWPWNDSRPGAHVARAVAHYLLDQVEAGVGCPLTMTFAAVPALRHQPDVASEWVPRITSTQYDARMLPAVAKTGCLMGMAMTEKQGGSDVRANTTRAVALGAEGPGQEYHLTGHKWFCSAPMCDAFLTLAYTERGLSCFLVPRWLPDGTRNRFHIQRLKNKLGNKSNASSEIEYRDTYARMVGEEGRGVPTIIEMVNHTRLDCTIGSAAMMRQALAQATHHCAHRGAFGKTLNEQPLMQNVLADLAVEWEAATTLMLRLARGYDDGTENPQARAFTRLATAVGKYWVCKRGPAMVYEALECLGGGGYVEESIMPRIYREAPLTSIWEGSGNVMCLDVLRAMRREPESVEAFMLELAHAKGADARLDAHVASLQAELANLEDIECRARRVVEKMALALQGALLVQHAPGMVADAFCASRLAGDWGREYGSLPPGLPLQQMLLRATPALD